MLNQIRSKCNVLSAVWFKNIMAWMPDSDHVWSVKVRGCRKLNYSLHFHLLTKVFGVWSVNDTECKESRQIFLY